MQMDMKKNNIDTLRFRKILIKKTINEYRKIIRRESEKEREGKLKVIGDLNRCVGLYTDVDRCRVVPHLWLLLSQVCSVLVAYLKYNCEGELWQITGVLRFAKPPCKCVGLITTILRIILR